jgi:hypothetical protein
METTAFEGWDPVGSKIVINDNIIEKINTFSYLGYCIQIRMKKMLLLKYQNSSR